jgi:hypothetical protein
LPIWRPKMSRSWEFETFHNFLVSEIESFNIIVIELNYLPFQVTRTPHAFLQRS